MNDEGSDTAAGADLACDKVSMAGIALMAVVLPAGVMMVALAQMSAAVCPMEPCAEGMTMPYVLAIAAGVALVCTIVMWSLPSRRAYLTAKKVWFGLACAFSVPPLGLALRVLFEVGGVLG